MLAALRMGYRGIDTSEMNRTSVLALESFQSNGGHAPVPGICWTFAGLVALRR